MVRADDQRQKTESRRQPSDIRPQSSVLSPPNIIGIMQGRLLPRVENRFQSFPGIEWKNEFHTAKEIGLETIEMIYDTFRTEDNPLNSDEGLKEICKLEKMTGIKILSVCADYFMTKGFLRVSEKEKNENLMTLMTLTRRCQKAAIKFIVIPFVDESEIKNEEELKSLEQLFKTVIDNTSECDVVYALEVSMPADVIGCFLENFSHCRMMLNYDTGNSASLGYDLQYEIKRLKKFIVDVHIKDRKLHGGTCLLGLGDTDFDAAFKALKEIDYKGHYILQTQRGDNEIETAKRHLEFVKEKLEKYKR